MPRLCRYAWMLPTPSTVRAAVEAQGATLWLHDARKAAQRSRWAAESVSLARRTPDTGAAFLHGRLHALESAASSWPAR